MVDSAVDIVDRSRIEMGSAPSLAEHLHYRLHFRVHEVRWVRAACRTFDHISFGMSMAEAADGSSATLLPEDGSMR